MQEIDFGLNEEEMKELASWGIGDNDTGPCEGGSEGDLG